MSLGSSWFNAIKIRMRRKECRAQATRERAYASMSVVVEASWWSCAAHRWYGWMEVEATVEGGGLGWWRSEEKNTIKVTLAYLYITTFIKRIFVGGQSHSII
jgi:hypothetical protein